MSIPPSTSPILDLEPGSVQSVNRPMSGTQSVELVIHEHTFPVDSLTGFSFTVTHSGTADPDVINGTLHAEGLEPLNILFRPRNIPNSEILKCTFVDLSLEDKARLEKFIHIFEGSNRKGDELEEMSYDQIAGSKKSPKKSSKAKSTKNRGRAAKVATVLGVMAAIVLVGAIFVGGIIKSKGSIPLSNSTLVGNYLAVESLSPGVVTSLNVLPNERVEQGQVLFYVKGREDLLDSQELAHKITELNAEIKVYEHHITSAKEEIERSLQTMEANYEALASLMAQATEAVEACEKHEKNLRSLMEEGVIGAPRVDEARVQTAQARLELETRLNEQRQLGEGLKSAREGRYTQNEQAKAELQNHQLALGLAKVKRDSLLARQEEMQPKVPVLAPIGGIVSTIYQETGTFVKAGETVVAITREDNNWAVGHVLASDAPKMRHGLEVKVRVPSIKKTYTGYITGVGHRALYSQGEWSSDFRTAVPSATPVKVDVPELANLPSGLRMEMTVKLDNAWPWQAWYREKKSGREGKPAPDDTTPLENEKATFVRTSIE